MEFDPALNARPILPVWSPSGDRIASWRHAAEGIEVHIWNASNGQLLRGFKLSSVGPVRWSPDGTRLAVLELGGFLQRSAGRRASRWPSPAGFRAAWPLGPRRRKMRSAVLRAATQCRRKDPQGGAREHSSQPAAVCSRRVMRASRDTAAALPTRRPLRARHDLSCAALVHTEELLDRRAVEVSGCHGTQGAEDFVKSMKAGGLGGHGGTPALLHVRERSGIMAFSGAAGGGAYHV